MDERKLLMLISFYVFFCNSDREFTDDDYTSFASSFAVGDTVLTTSGFYGIVIDMDDETVIVEFGNNKNCRIPMQKAAITEVEKPGDAAAAAEADKKEDKKDKKDK